MREQWNIAICDDDDTVLSYMAEKIKQKFFKYGMQTVCETFETSVGLLGTVEKGKDFQAYFLDISMPDVDGITLGKEILRRHEDAVIIFVSARESDIFHVFEASPFGFIRKSNFLEDLDRTAADFAMRYKEEREEICWIEEKDGEYMPLKIQQVLFLRGKGDKVYAVTDENTFWIENSFKRVYEILNEYPFVRTDKSCLVNLKMISHMEKNRLFLDDGTELSVGYCYKKNVKRQICKYLI